MLSDETRQFDFQFEELEISALDLEILMGFHPEELPEPFPEMISSAMGEAPQLFEIKAGYRRIQNMEFLQESRQIKVGDLIFSPGKIIFSQVRKAVEIAFFAGTAGERVTSRCQQLNLRGDSVYSYVLDALGSVVAEKAVEKMMDLMVFNSGKSGISESFSPGYCNWDVAEQHMMFSLLPPRFCGISLSPSSLMNPVKSVSGIIGIGPEMKRSGYHCHHCNDKNCIYRKLRHPEL